MAPIAIRPTRWAALGLLAVLALLASPFHAAAQPPAEEPQATFGERIEVRLQTYVVRALDDYGDPILGLQREDFRVTAGKREIPVSVAAGPVPAGQLHGGDARSAYRASASSIASMRS